LLDLFCGAGGAAMGYWRAGFHVTGVDIAPQPNYCGDKFIQGDALEFVDRYWQHFDVIHASPPCQRDSAMTYCRPGLAETYPALIAPTRELLKRWGGLWVIENVPGSPLIDPTWLCGQMFGLELYRHRGFESSFPITAPEHPAHVMPASRAGHWTPGTVMSVAGHVAPMRKAREVMGGINWMTRDELGESIPPAYTEHIGRQLIDALARAA
jgi:DNA (cytosine-5)-methyltransferase 1